MSKKESVVSTTSVVEAPGVDESGWKQELEQLDRLLIGRLTEGEAKEYAETELAKHDGVVNTIETEIARGRAVLTSTSFLPRADRKRLEDRIESLEGDLANARKLREQSILKHGAGIRAAKDADKHRPRWQELRQRQQTIEAATGYARGRQPELNFSMPHRFVG
jgi:hypothetical protein